MSPAAGDTMLGSPVPGSPVMSSPVMSSPAISSPMGGGTLPELYPLSFALPPNWRHPRPPSGGASPATPCG